MDEGIFSIELAASWMPSAPVLAILAFMAALIACLQLRHLQRLANEFRTYSADNGVPDAPTGIVQAILACGTLDKHQKIVRTEALVAGGLTAIALAALIAIIALTW